MVLPVSAFDTTAVIELETDYMQVNTGKVNANQITIDNTLNLAVRPTIELTANGAISSITVTNVTSGRYFTYTGSLIANDKITMSNDIIYKNGTEVSGTFNAPFRLEENVANILRFTIVGGNSINVNVTWKKASGTQRTQSYLQGFSITENRTFQKRTGGALNLYTKDAKLMNVGYSFQIDKMWYTTEIFADNPGSSYRITYQAQASDIDSQKVTLCGCRFENINLSQQEVGMIKDSVSGFALRRF